MEVSYHRHDISDKVWALLESHLPGQRGQWEESSKITDVLLTQCFGCCEPERLGVIYPQITGNGELSESWN